MPSTSFADTRGSSGHFAGGVGPLPPSAEPGMEPQNPPSQKKSRTQFTPRQLYYLEEKFLTNQFPTSKEREIISKELDLTQHHIQVTKIQRKEACYLKAMYVIDRLWFGEGER